MFITIGFIVGFIAGWWVNENPNCDVMVLNPKRFVTLVHSMPTCLSDADIRTIENNLIRVLRA